MCSAPAASLYPQCQESMTAKCQHNIVNSCFRCCRVPFIHLVVPLHKHYLHVCSQHQIRSYFPAKTMNYLGEAVVGFMYWQDDICKVKLGEKEILKSWQQKALLIPLTALYFYLFFKIFLINVSPHSRLGFFHNPFFTKQLNLPHLQLLSVFSVHSHGLQKHICT